MIYNACNVRSLLPRVGHVLARKTCRGSLRVIVNVHVTACRCHASIAADVSFPMANQNDRYDIRDYMYMIYNATYEAYYLVLTMCSLGKHAMGRYM